MVRSPDCSCRFRATSLAPNKGMHGGRAPKDTNPPMGAVVTVVKAPKNPIGVGYVTVEDEHGNVYNAVEPKRLHLAPYS